MNADLIDAAAELWPGAEVVAAGTTCDARPVRARYAVVSRGRTPTVLVPMESSTAAGASLRRVSAASSWWDSTSRAAASAAVRVAPGLLRNRVEIRGGEAGLGDHLSAVLGTPVTFSITIGTARVNRKPVLQVFDEQGECRAFVKVGWSPNTCVDVAAEGRALALVTCHDYRYVVPPALLARTSWQGRPVLVTAPLAPSAWARHHRPGAPPEAAMDELALRFGSRIGRLADSAWWHRQWEVVGELPGPVERGRFGRALEQVAHVCGRRPLRWGAWHGDWTPWNMAHSGEEVLLWDWERFEMDVPLGLDRVHYFVQAFPGGPSSAEGTLRALARAAYPDHGFGGAPHLQSLLYLVAILTRYLRLAGGPGGEHISRRAAQTLLALERLSDP